ERRSRSFHFYSFRGKLYGYFRADETVAAAQQQIMLHHVAGLSLSKKNMPRIKLELPEHFSFHTTIPIRITDINYGGHAGNDSMLSIIHEARMQFLQQQGYDETNFAGVGLIMSDVAIEFKKELFYGDAVHIAVTATAFERVSFD